MAWGAKTESGGMPKNTGGSLSFIGNEAQIHGDVKTKGDLHIDGMIEGNLICSTAILGKDGRIRGNLTAERATIGGVVDGNLDAADVAIEKSAKISGDVSYSKISIEAGARVEGRLVHRGANAPGELKLVSAGE